MNLLATCKLLVILVGISLLPIKILGTSLVHIQLFPIHKDCRVESWWLEATPLATHLFKRSYRISHPPRLWVSPDALPSFAALFKRVKVGLSKWISYIIQIFLFFSMKNKCLGTHFLLKSYFCNFNFKTRLLLKSSPIFDETTKLWKASKDTYNWGGWLIL